MIMTMRPAKHPVKFRMSLALMAATILLAGCGSSGNETQTESTTASVQLTATITPVGTNHGEPTPGQNLVLPPGDEPAATVKPKLDEESNHTAARRLIALFTEIQEAKKADASVTPEELSSLEQQWPAALDGCPEPIPLSREVELAAYDFQHIDKEDYKYSLKLLFEVKGKITEDYLLSIMGYVDPSHVEQLPEGNRDAGYAAWGFEPKPGTSRWFDEALKIGGRSYFLVSRPCRDSREIPYNVRMVFYQNDNTGKFVGRYGNQISLGWVADLER